MDSKHKYLLEDRAAARKAHFAAGHTPTMWRGNAMTFQDKKKRRSQAACRSWRAKEEA